MTTTPMTTTWTDHHATPTARTASAFVPAAARRAPAAPAGVTSMAKPCPQPFPSAEGMPRLRDGLIVTSSAARDAFDISGGDVTVLPSTTTGPHAWSPPD